MPHVLDSLPSAFRETAAGRPDRRDGRSNKRYEVSDAAGCAPACFFTRCESFLAFQRRMERDGSRSNCRTLCGVGRIPCDSRIRNLLDDLDPAAFDPLFRPCLATVAAQGALAPFQRLDERLPAAPDGVRFHRSDKVHGPQCSVRRVGSERRPHHFHAMVAATAVADGHATVLPLMPEFACPQQDAAATRADMSEDERKRDCERNAAKRWLAARGAWLQACRPVLPGDDLLLLPAGLRDRRGGRHGLHPGMQARIPQALVRGAGEPAGERRGKGKRSERHRFRRTAAVPLRQGRDALPGTWLEYAVERDGKRTCASSFFAGLAVTADNAERIARAGRARWKIENEGFKRGLQLPGAARPQLQAQLRARQGRAGQRAGRAEPVRLRAPRRGAVRLCAVAAVPAPAGHAPRPVAGAAGRAALVPLPGPADAAGGGARRTRASGLPGGRAAGAWTPRSFVPAASCRGLGTPRTRDAGRTTALPAVRRSRGAASGAQPLGQLIHLILRNNLHAPP